MSQLGARFREAREARGLTIAEVAARTRILPQYLYALEEGEYGALPGDVYARGFIRNYAQLLDLPADELMALYRRERGGPTEKIQVVPAAVPPRTRSCLLPSAVVSFFSILALLAVLYVLANVTGLTAQSTEAIAPTPTRPVPTPTQFPTAEPQPSGTLPSRLPQTEVPLVSPNSSASPGPSPTPSAPLVVEVRVAPDATTGSWMQITVDGQSRITGIMAAGWSERFEAQREVFVHAGDASVVELTVNGENRGRMGTVKGGVAKETLTPPTVSGSTP